MGIRAPCCRTFFASIPGHRSRILFHGFSSPFGLHFGTIVHHFGITFSSIDFASIFHRFWDGFCIDFPSFLDVKLAPLPNLANLLNWNKYRTRALFYYPRELGFFWIFLSSSVSDFIPNSTYFWTSFFITFGAQN